MNEDHQPYIEKCFYLNKLQIQKYNDPMLQGKHMATLIFFSFSMILFIILFRDMKSKVETFIILQMELSTSAGATNELCRVT